MQLTRVPFQRWPFLLHVALASALLLAILLSVWWSLGIANASHLSIQNQHAELQAQVNGTPAATVVPDTFANSLPNSTKVDDVSRDIGKFAQNFGIRVASLAIDPKASTKTELGRVHFNVSAQADYKSAKSWLAELLGRYPSLGIQSMSVRSSSSDATRQEIRIVLALYVKD